MNRCKEKKKYIRKKESKMGKTKVMIGNHEITDYASFMKVAEENEKLQQENKELKERLDRMTFLFGLDDSSQETVFEKLENEIEQLQQENKQLKDKLDKIREHIQSKISNDYDEQDCCINAIDEFCVELLDFIEEVNK